MAKRGRKAGAAGCSFLGVTLGELNRVLKEGATVMVSRKYAEQLNLEGSPILAEANNKHIETYTNIIESNEVDLDSDKEVEQKEVDLQNW